jgi:hypothetical protein
MQQTPKPSLVADMAPLVPAVPPTPESMKTGRPMEIGGPPGPEPTRYGDWERNGRCVDF